MDFHISFDFKRNRHRNEFHPIVLCFYINIEWNEAKNVEVAWITRWISHPLMPLAYNKEHASIRSGVQFRKALQLKQCQYFVIAYQNPYRCGIINFIEFWKIEFWLKFWWWVIAHEIASHYGLLDFIRFQEKPPQKRVPSNRIVFLHQYRVEWSIKRGSWMDNSSDITSTDATGAQ